MPFFGRALGAMVVGGTAASAGSSQNVLLAVTAVSKRFGGVRAPPRKGQDIETEITVSLEDSYNGATRSLSLSIPTERYDLDTGRNAVTSRRVEAASGLKLHYHYGTLDDLFVAVFRRRAGGSRRLCRGWP